MRLASVLSRTIASVVSVSGAALAALFVALELIAGILEDSAVTALIPDTTGLTSFTGQAPLAITTSITILVTGYIAYIIITLISAVGAHRALNDTLETQYFTRNMGWAILNYVIGHILFLIAYGVIGLFTVLTASIPLLVILSLPLGLAAAAYVYIAFYTWPAHVAIHDKNVVNAILDAFEDIEGRRLKTTGYVITFHVAYIITAFLAAIPVVTTGGATTAIIEAIAVGILTPVYVAFTVKLHGALTKTQTS